MAQTAAHLVERVMPWVPTRPWVVSVPVPVRYWMAASQELTATVPTISRTTIGQYDVSKAVARSFPRAQVQPGAVTFMQRLGSAINLKQFEHPVMTYRKHISLTALANSLLRLEAEPFIVH